MPSTQNKVLVVVAAGPLIGVAVSTLFIVKGFTHVALISRSLSRLSEDVNLVLQRAKESGNSDAIVKAYVGDVLNPENITSILKQIEADLGAPEVVVYNAAVISRGGLGDFTEEELVEEFKISTVGLYTTAKWAFPQLLSRKSVSHSKPTFIVTGGGVYKNPRPTHLSLSLNKAAQFNLAGSLTKIYEPQGIHVGVVVVNKAITYEEKNSNPTRIAQEYWNMYEQEEGKWEQVIDMGYW